MDYLAQLHWLLDRMQKGGNMQRVREIKERIATEERRRAQGFGTPEEPPTGQEG